MGTRDGQRLATQRTGVRRFSLAATEARERLHLQMVTVLVDAGVPKDLKDERQMTAFDYAKFYGDIPCCRIFDKNYGEPALQRRAQTPDIVRPDTPDLLSEMSTRPSTPGVGLAAG